METRIDELEVKLAFAEDLLEALNKTVYRQQQQIEGLQKEMRELRKQMAASMPGEQRSLRDEIPPHY
jgi:SlyX protein